MKSATIFISFLLLVLSPFLCHGNQTLPGGEIKSIDQLSFRGKSEDMFKAVVDASPFFIRGITRKSMTKGIMERCHSGIVTEDVIREVVRSVTPKKYLEQTLKIADNV
uniref:Uncharacterized protein n=1 Tax=Helicotheca tamesis TaxID=374047 RepID=A0A7S2H068_9STRA|mmetsp:Transcript_13923/g.19055  ORF Transcript_13923/g.19055 Transcript_13923/m.19055 type:complete len:108 (+) Transcript_13923:95-418(+)|eukprot:CAMPEP_0185729426 /NCGR_PEP_ID=MMETSP1171-20130828/5709_1 /TAXON_ID=374046 /ORGANISM="Helicotheca tamensis, Strain CCMP826" /LENGTH=107 /DNA_ID=CAMNT_0028398261 /DNA_START=39 /DNA_END=362 /DNA_ORIENTATION=+